MKTTILAVLAIAGCLTLAAAPFVQFIEPEVQMSQLEQLPCPEGMEMVAIEREPQRSTFDVIDPLEMFTIGTAHAAPIEPVISMWKFADAGQPHAAVTPMRTYSLQCRQRACAKFSLYPQSDGGPTFPFNCATNGATDIPVSNIGSGESLGARLVFQTGAVNHVWVSAADGGDPQCSLALETVNP